MKVQRLDSYAVARQYQTALALRPDSYREHPPQPAKTIFIPFQKRVQQNFRVAVATKLVACTGKFGAQFAVIINFPVENQNGVAVGTPTWLRSALEIDDLQAHRAQRYQTRLMDGLLIRTAMDQTCCGTPNDRWVKYAAAVRIARYTTQSL